MKSKNSLVNKLNETVSKCNSKTTIKMEKIKIKNKNFVLADIAIWYTAISKCKNIFPKRISLTRLN